MNPETETPPGEGGAGGTDATVGETVKSIPQSALLGNIPDALKALPQSARPLQEQHYRHAVRCAPVFPPEAGGYHEGRGTQSRTESRLRT